VPQALDDVLRRVDEAQREMRLQALTSPTAAQSPAQGSLLGGAQPAAPVEARPAGQSATAFAAPASRPTVPAPASTRGSARTAAPSPTPASSPAGAPAAPAAPPASMPASSPTASASMAAAPPAGDAQLATAWERVVEEVMKKKPTLGAVLTQARPSGPRDRELTIALVGNHFHREMLADAANRDLVVQAVRRCVPGAERINVVSGEETTGAIASHPAVQAAIAEFQGEVVAVRPRLPEGEGQ
jgi:hypothetical protein